MELSINNEQYNIDYFNQNDNLSYISVLSVGKITITLHNLTRNLHKINEQRAIPVV